MSNGILNGSYCWCCDRPMVPAMAKRKKVHGGIVERQQFGPRYCVGCQRNGRKVVKRQRKAVA